MRTISALAVFAPAILALATDPGRAAEPPVPDYSRDVAPLLKKYCAGCHNADEPEGELSLESYADLQKGGQHGPAVLPGESKSSRLVRLLTGEAEPRMPPPDNEMPTAGEIELLIAWIDGGAKGPAGVEPDRKTLLTPRIEPQHQRPRGITAIACSTDGRHVAARFSTVELVDSESGKILRRLEGFPGKVNAVHFSADGRLLVTASGVTGLYGEAVLWDVASGRRLREFSAHRDVMYDAELSPGGQLLATCGYDRRIIIWDARSGQQLRTLDGHNDAVYDLEFSPDGTVLASASGDETVKVWQAQSGLRLDTLSQPQAEQYAVTFSPDGRYIVAGGADNRIRVWRFVSRRERRINPLVYARYAHEGAVVALAFSADAQALVSAGEDLALKQWETGSFTQVHAYERQTDEVAAVAIPGSRQVVMVARLDGSVSRYPLARREPPTERTAAPPAPAAASIAADDMSRFSEKEPNDLPAEAQTIEAPFVVQGVINPPRGGASRDVDLFRFAAETGQQWIVETNAARRKSPLDSKVEVLDAEGNPIVRVMLRAVRDSYFTFRGQNSSTSDGFRLHNWEEMELNEYLYSDGEVVKLWHYPRGPDSGFMLYPGRGDRYTYFDTTPTSHPLQAPCYIVESHAPGTPLISNGLPVFPIYYENDDDSRRRLGTDSRLTFTAPAAGEYLVRVSDTRGFAGADFKYDLTVRPRVPDFKVTLGGANSTVNAGSGKEFTVTADRIDGFDGEIRVDIDGLPPGFHATAPLVIEAGQTMAFGTINAEADAPSPSTQNAKASRVTATALVAGQEITRDVNGFGEIKLAGKPKVLVEIRPDDDSAASPAPGRPVELFIAPGETITARVRVQRDGFEKRIPFGNADSGRNLPHGVFVDNIGLNGLLIVAGKSERTFFITAAKWVPETTRTFHLRAQVEGNQTSWPVILHVRRPDQVAARGDRTAE